MARPVTAVMAMLFLVVLAFGPAGEVASEPVTGSVAVLSAPGGGSTHDCHQEPLHGTHYVAAQRADQARSTQHQGGTNLKVLPAGLWIDPGADLTVARRAGPSGDELRAWCSPHALQVFRR